MFLECIMWNNPWMYYVEQTSCRFQGTHLVFMLGNAPCTYFQGTYHVFLFNEHTSTLYSRNISRNEHIVSNGSIPLPSYEIASNDPHGE
jgi:hypothetical protein